MITRARGRPTSVGGKDEEAPRAITRKRKIELTNQAEIVLSAHAMTNHVPIAL